MKAFLVAISLLIAAPALAADIAIDEPTETPPQALPTEPPPFVPALVPIKPLTLPIKNPAPDLKELMKLLNSDDDDDDKTVEFSCDTRPCVPAYRFSDSVDDDSVKKFEKFMKSVAKAKPDMVMIELNTPGGSLDDGHEMSRLIENAPFPTVCVVDHVAASMGMYLLQSCGTRVMTKRSQLMIHQVALIVSRARLTEVSLENLKNQLRTSTRSYIEWVTHRMKISATEMLQKVNDTHEYFLDWQEALKSGAVDKVVDGPPDVYLRMLRQGAKP
jgi:ATP-dependent protease ClpP protease subunit